MDEVAHWICPLLLHSSSSLITTFIANASRSVNYIFFPSTCAITIHLRQFRGIGHHIHLINLNQQLKLLEIFYRISAAEINDIWIFFAFERWAREIKTTHRNDAEASRAVASEKPQNAPVITTLLTVVIKRNINWGFFLCCGFVDDCLTEGRRFLSSLIVCVVWWTGRSILNFEFIIFRFFHITTPTMTTRRRRHNNNCTVRLGHVNTFGFRLLFLFVIVVSIKIDLVSRTTQRTAITPDAPALLNIKHPNESTVKNRPNQNI